MHTDPASEGSGDTIDLSVVIPAYNEEDCIGPCVREVRDVLDPLGLQYEIVVVDDGSTDGTIRILGELADEVPQLVVFPLDGNHGQTAAFEAGFRHSRGRAVATMDADMQNDPADIPNMLPLLEQWDVVCGVRRKRNDSIVRRISSRVANAIRNWLTHESIRDVGCSMRIMKAEVVAGLKLFNGLHRFLPTLMRMDGWTITEVMVNHRPRHAGRAKYGIGNRALRALRDLFAVRWMMSRWLKYEVKEWHR